MIQAPSLPEPIAQGVTFPQLARLAAKALGKLTLASSLLSAALVFAVVVIPALLGSKTMVVTSGSMEPAIGTGDAAVIKPISPDLLVPGDVITFSSREGQGMVTHRIIAIKRIQGLTYFQTQGDANQTPDPNLTDAGSVYGKVAFTFPKLGYLLYFSATPWGNVLLIGLPMLVLTVQEVQSLLRRRKPRGGAHHATAPRSSSP